jgi:hypothetical protein
MVGRVFFDFDKLSSGIHTAISEWLVRRLREGKNRFLVMIPRDHLKTSLLGISLPTWLLLRDPNQRILHTMATRKEAQKTMDVVQRAFMSERMKHFFPDRHLDPHDPDMKATREMMIIRRPFNWREACIESIGLDSSITGGHFTTQLFDDLIDETMRNSIVQQERAIGFVRHSTSLLVSMKNDLRIIWGTDWEGEFYEWILDDENEVLSDYETLILGCFVDDRYRDFLASIGKKTTLKDGDPIWPEEFDVETLQRVRRELGPNNFSRQFLNIPTEDVYKRFHEEDFIIYTYSPDRQSAVIGEGEDAQRFPFRKMRKYMVIDPATGEGKKSDETAISVVGVDSSGFKFVLEDWAARALPHEVIEQIFAFHDKWDVDFVCPEDVSFQKVFKHFIKPEMVKRGARFSIRPVKPGNVSKGTRIEALEPFARAGEICCRKEHLDGFVKEAVNVVIVRGMVQGKSPNRIDALAYQTTFWGSPKTRNRKKPRGEDIDEWDALEMEVGAKKAYGLACRT